MRDKAKDAAGLKAVEFEFFAPEAKEVRLAGGFNLWNPEATPLKKSKNGKWKATLHLEPGRYEYRFWVDGDWQNDQRTVECVPNPFGTWNCVLTVQ
ncbi:MAG TPA: isoamylase early set domain-containing protein [Verrucomicrobiae bacterium]|jgi:5'-AMP-activated protein kinase regulatory beta subunit|nr:isoamylase early set domain-containing protein [Verrucomicrobiae bacterium]